MRQLVVSCTAKYVQMLAQGDHGVAVTALRWRRSTSWKVRRSDSRPPEKNFKIVAFFNCLRVVFAFFV